MAKMGRPTGRKLNPFIEEWLKQGGFSNIYDAAQKCDIPSSTLHRWSDLERDLANFESILVISSKMGMTPTELIQGLLAGKKQHLSLLDSIDQSEDDHIAS